MQELPYREGCLINDSANILKDLFPVWKQMTAMEQETLSQYATTRDVPAGTLLHNGSQDCVGLFLVEEGQLRAYILTDEGKELTLYRLFDRDMCLFSASCMMNNIQFEICVEAEKQTKLLVIPTTIYESLMQNSAAISNYTNQLMASRFSDVMWLMDQVLFKSFDARLAAFLLEESNINDTDELTITHEKIAHHLGTAREVVTRMLKYFHTEGMVSLSRGKILIQDADKLSDLAD